MNKHRCLQCINRYINLNANRMCSYEDDYSTRSNYLQLVAECPHYQEYQALRKLRQTFHKWLKYKDETLLDLALAVKVHSYWLKLNDIAPLWLFVIGASGSGKTEFARAFEVNDDYYLLNHLTSNTLATGWKKNRKYDLAPILNEKKFVLTYDFAQFLKLDHTTKNNIWSQFRMAYDGYVQRDTGSGVNTLYTDLSWDWLVATTPLIDSELILKDQLGTRELMYRHTSDIEVNIKQEQVWKNTQIKKQMRNELKEAIKEYLHWRTSQEIEPNSIEVSEFAKNHIFMLARFIALLRANAESDPQTGELTELVYPEEPTRNLEQLRGVFMALRSLSPYYTEKLALKRLEAIAKSSINPIRHSILKYVVKSTKNGNPISTNRIKKKLMSVSYRVILRELYTLHQLGLLDYNEGINNIKEWYVSEDLTKDKKEVIEFVCESKIIEFKPTIQTESTIQTDLRRTLDSYGEEEQ